MTTCPHCALTLPDTAAFCARCGTAVTRAREPEAPATVVMPTPTATPDPYTGPAVTHTSPPTAPPAQAATAPAGPRGSGSKTGLIVGLVVGGALLVMALAGVGAVVFLGHRASDAFASAASTLDSSTPNMEQPTPDAGATDGQDPNAVPTEDIPTTENTPEPTESPVGQSATDPWALPSDGKVCSVSGRGAYATAATGNDHTSCPFATAVRKAYLASHADGSPVTLNVTSPVTHQAYDMTCEFIGPITCTGGNDAMVLIGNATKPIAQ